MQISNKKKVQYLRVLCLIIFGHLFYSCNSGQQSGSDIELLQEHYATYTLITKFALSYEQFVPTPYQSYDYLKPDSLHNSININIDINKNQYVSEYTFRYPGILSFDYTSYHNGSEGYWYDGGNGTAMGKSLFEGSKERIKSIEDGSRKLVDLLMVQNLFSTTKKPTDTLFSIASKQKNEINIETIGNSSKDTMVYTFSKKPVALLSVYHKKNKQKYIFSEHGSVGNFHIAGKIEVLAEGKHQSAYKINAFETIDKVEAKKLSHPKDRTLSNPDREDPLKAVAISKGTYIIQYLASRRNVMLQISGNTIIVLGAPGRNKMSEKVIALIERKFPNKKIKHVYVSHFHIDHTEGLKAYAKKGISILADKYSIKAIKANPFFESDSMTFQPIVHKQTLMGIRFYLLESDHSKAQTFAYIPKAKVIYEGDFIEMPIDKSIPSYMPASTKIFLDYIEQEQIDVKRIVGHHTSHNITREMWEAYLLKVKSQPESIK